MTHLLPVTVVIETADYLVIEIVDKDGLTTDLEVTSEMLREVDQ